MPENAGNVGPLTSILSNIDAMYERSLRLWVENVLKQRAEETPAGVPLAGTRDQPIMRGPKARPRGLYGPAAETPRRDRGFRAMSQDDVAGNAEREALLRILTEMMLSGSIPRG
jgi:hypothetical protein